MQFEHEGVLVTHPRLYRAFLRGVRFLDDEGVFVVQLGHFRGQIEVEDTPFWVTAYDADTGDVELTDRSVEPLEPDSLVADRDDVLRCTVKSRFPARFTHAAQAMLLDALDTQREPPRIRVAGAWCELPGLAC